MRKTNAKNMTTLQYYLKDEGYVLPQKLLERFAATARRLHRVHQDLDFFLKMNADGKFPEFTTDQTRFPLVIVLPLKDILFDINPRIDSKSRSREILIRQRTRRAR